MKTILAAVFVATAIGSFALLEARIPVMRTIAGGAGSGKAQEAQVLFVGDMMFDRHIRSSLARGTDVLGDVSDLLAAADLNVGNLEGPVTDYPSQSRGTKVGDLTNMRFTFAPEIRELLLAHNFRFVSIGNNHIRDYGDEGVRQTTAYLAASGIGYVGDPSGAQTEPVIKEVNGIRIAFVSYSDFRTGDAGRASEAIARADADATVVLAHWGNEYEPEPSPRIRELAHSFVLAGADLVIGSHPHVIGSVEDVGPARIYYSLGNFVFDQYWERSVRCGLAVTATFAKRGNATTIQYQETQVGMQTDGRTVLGCS